MQRFVVRLGACHWADQNQPLRGEKFIPVIWLGSSVNWRWILWSTSSCAAVLGGHAAAPITV